MNPTELKEKREAWNLSQAELADAIERTRLTVNRWENGSKIPPAAQKLLKMFFGDERNMPNKKQNDAVESIKKEREKQLPKKGDAVWIDYETSMKVPLVHHRAQAGFLSGWGDPEYLEELPRVTFDVDKEYKGQYVCFEVAGDSMSNENSVDSLLERDILLCREVQRHHWQSRLHIHSWKYFVVVHRQKGILVKQIIDHNTTTGVLTLHSLNPYFEDQKVHLDDLIAIFNVVDIRRSARR